VGAAWIVTEDGHADDFWPWMLWALAWATGTFVRRRGDVAAHHAARAALLEVEARTTASESALAERDRIARELHDVIAHSVSVMVVQAGAERVRLGGHAGPTGDALAAIEDSGRTALAELRAMLGVLRDAAGEPLAPVPGLDLLPELLERVRDAGLPVAVDCRPAGVLDDSRLRSSGAGLAAYRIVQEALTNVMRHQGLVPTRVELEATAECLLLTVTNPSSGPPTLAGPSGGRGLTGMRERATAVGGTFEAGAEESEYVVRARLPLGAAVTS
jgi:signal transduction histidine kinase